MRRPPASRILGTGHYLPQMVRTNQDISKMVDTSDEWIRERTGISERRVAAPDECTSDLASAAAKNALDAAGVKASELSMIIVATVTPDMPMPATAVFVQQKIGATCAAFDLSAACAGFVYGLSIADKFIAGDPNAKVLVIGVELLSRVVNWEDRTTCVLFGDGAGAAVLGAAEGDRGLLGTELFTDGSLGRALMIPGGGSISPASVGVLEARDHKVKMEGRAIFKAAVKNLYSASQRVVTNAGLKNEEVDWVVPHQANQRIIHQVTTKAKYSDDKVLSNIARVGNTSSASIPILLDESIRNGTIKEGQVVLMCALGAGVSWGAAVSRM